VRHLVFQRASAPRGGGAELIFGFNRQVDCKRHRSHFSRPFCRRASTQRLPLNCNPQAPQRTALASFGTDELPAGLKPQSRPWRDSSASRHAVAASQSGARWPAAAEMGFAARNSPRLCRFRSAAGQHRSRAIGSAGWGDWCRWRGGGVWRWWAWCIRSATIRATRRWRMPCAWRLAAWRPRPGWWRVIRAAKACGCYCRSRTVAGRTKRAWRFASPIAGRASGSSGSTARWPPEVRRARRNGRRPPSGCAWRSARGRCR
jgi:hypothetical protein